MATLTIHYKNEDDELKEVTVENIENNKVYALISEYLTYGIQVKEDRNMAFIPAHRIVKVLHEEV